MFGDTRVTGFEAGLDDLDADENYEKEIHNLNASKSDRWEARTMIRITQLAYLRNAI